MHSFSETPGYVTRFCGKRISFIGSFHRLPGVYVLGKRGRKGRGRGRDSDTFLINVRQKFSSQAPPKWTEMTYK